LIAKQRGIDVREVKRDQAEDYQTLIRLTIATERQQRTVAGTLFGGDKPRIVEIKGIKIEAELSPHMLYFTNEDKPGLIGGMGQILGDAGLNIATFHLGRVEAGGAAIGLVSTDSDASEQVLDQLRALPFIVQVKALRF
jgi:D-3-phosphoglycerate dehydrogenase